MNTELLAQASSLLDQFAQAFSYFSWALYFIPYWGPPVLAVVFWRMWLRYIKGNFIANQETILLEIRLPQEVMKSPVAMQAVLDGLFTKSGESTFIDRLWFGKVRMWYSLEFASIEGEVHMYIWFRKAFRRTIERVFYAHYPDAELVEVDDYTLKLPYSLETHESFGADFKLGEAIGVPIRTYVDYKLDQTSTKEEQKVDPIAHVFEFLGSMSKGEQVWIQILIRGNKKEDITFGSIRNRKSYKEHVKEELSRISSNPEDTIVFPDGGSGKVLSDSQVKRIQAINRVSSQGTHWDVGIRVIYIAEKDQYDGTTIPSMMTLWQPFGSPGFNSIIADGSRWQPIFDYPWQDFNGMRENKRKVQIIDAFRRRSWFHKPYEFKNFMMTSEELATLFHLPGTVAKTQTLQRITSSRAQAPTNLPK